MDDLVRTRLISLGDNSAVAAIIREVMPQFGAVGDGFAINDPEVDMMYEAYQDDRCKYYVIELNGVVCGGGGLAPLKGGDGSVCEIQKMYFLTSLRGKGAGRALLQRLVSDARAMGYTTAYLETMEGMRAARALYESLGFQRLSTPMGSTGHGGCDVWYMLAL